MIYYMVRRIEIDGMPLQVQDIDPDNVTVAISGYFATVRARRRAGHPAARTYKGG